MKPDSMWYMPETESSSTDQSDDGPAGLSPATAALGEGAALYLQSMKILAWMFVVLSIINFPLLLIYPAPTKHNDYTNAGSVFGLFTLGNMARPNPACGFSDLKKDMIYGHKMRSPEI